MPRPTIITPVIISLFDYALRRCYGIDTSFFAYLPSKNIESIGILVLDDGNVIEINTLLKKSSPIHSTDAANKNPELILESVCAFIFMCATFINMAKFLSAIRTNIFSNHGIVSFPLLYLYYNIRLRDCQLFVVF